MLKRVSTCSKGARMASLKVLRLETEQLKICGLFKQLKIVLALESKVQGTNHAVQFSGIQRPNMESSWQSTATLPVRKRQSRVIRI